MNGKDVARALSKESWLPLQDHDPPSPATLRKIAEGMAAQLSPVRPVAPAGYFLGAFVCIIVSIVALSVDRMGAFAIGAMTPLQTAAILSALAISSGLLASSLVHQMVPASRHGILPSLLPVAIIISLIIAIAVLFQFQHEQDFWANAWGCIRAGTPIGVLSAVPFWLVLRQGAVLSPSMTGAATGLLAGLVGASVLEIHCPNLDAWHILVSHAGVAMLCTLAGLFTGLTAEAFGRYSVHRSKQECKDPAGSLLRKNEEET
jgi:hypothetical protein